MFSTISGDLQQTTSHKMVLPFYAYAAISFLVACILLLLHSDVVHQHYFHPHTLAITHIMALGWGTMIILGASHQLLPVLVEGKLDSYFLASLTFIFTAIGIPILAIGFFLFHTGWMLQLGAILINIGVVCYVVNVFASSFNSKKRNVHAWYMIAASAWLFSTVFFGLLLVFNFNKNILPKDSLSYLTIHAHLGLIGWFLMLVIGVGSRLIPMFLISKYTNNKQLWWIFCLINASLISFIFFKIMEYNSHVFYIPIVLAFAGIALFVRHCYLSYKVRIRKNVDDQMKTSLLSVVQMVFPFLALLFVLILMPSGTNSNWSILYGFCFFFGWITAIILGMTFKTLTFIVWNKVYHKNAHAGKTPVPKDLFNEKIYTAMLISYIIGFVVFAIGIIILNDILLKSGAFALLLSAILYVINSGITLFHKPTNA